MVIVILAILLGIGLFFYFKFFKSDIERSSEALTTQKTNTLLVLAASMPELECSRGGSTKPCVDAMKALTLGTNSNDERFRSSYTELFKFRSVNIEVLYPTPQNRTCTQSTYPDCSIYPVFSNPPAGYTSSKEYSVISPIYYPETKTIRIGRIIIEEYS